MKPEELLPLEFRSGNDVPVEQATITRARMIEIIEEWNCRAQPAEPMKDDLPGMWEHSDLSGGATDCEPVKVPSDEIDIEDVRQYLESWGCLAHPGVRALLAKYAK
ncbi:MAG: hypothetical protein CML17_05035 [Pusillimonas sp.]|nr:hypothetical protein [Pusillimonas sp.]